MRFSKTAVHLFIVRESLILLQCLSTKCLILFRIKGHRDNFSLPQAPVKTGKFDQLSFFLPKLLVFEKVPPKRLLDLIKPEVEALCAHFLSDYQLP